MPAENTRPADPGRRRALQWLASLGAFGSAALAGIPALRAFLSPAFRHTTPVRWFKLGATASFDVGTPTKVDFTERVADAWVEQNAFRTVWVYTSDGIRFTVYSGRCTHLGCAFQFDAAPDPRYHRQANVFHCPCHHGVFDPKTGAVLAGPPPRPLDTLDTRIEGGVLFVAYETFRVGIPDKIVA
jgi:menaquinol-cytochrome c reductase iron-sulfur subunit